MWLIDHASSDSTFIDQLTGITQVVIQVIGSASGIDAEVVAAAGRAPTTVGRRLRLVHRDGHLEALGVPFGPQDDTANGYRIWRRGTHEASELASGSRALFEGKFTEAIVITSGVLEVTFTGGDETLHAGDSMVISHVVVQSWRNPGPERCTATWTLLR